MAGPWGRAVALAALAALAAACGGAAKGAEAARPSETTRPSETVVTEPVARPASTGAPSPVDRLFGVGDARQVISVIADDYGQTTGYLTAYERGPGGWSTAFGPWPVFVGANGFAPPGEKREGDGRTPTGAFGFDFAFGVNADPGTKLPFRRITSDAIVWDDDPASPRYNEWVDTTAQVAGADPEPMYHPPVYNYGVVIAYNVERTPGLGSAIFLHVARGVATTGCVSLQQERLLDLLRWLDPAMSPRIVMGTQDAVTP